ncbi:hypothetical protein LNP17_05760 [Klebsiella variicola subsp. variicola]|nr:hypothetical protein [Klebsiella variicola subsp. variicola]
MKARTGELTPPGISSRAAWYRFSDLLAARVLVREKCFIGYSKLFQDGYESFAQLKQCAARAFFDDAARRDG